MARALGRPVELQYRQGVQVASRSLGEGAIRPRSVTTGAGVARWEILEGRKCRLRWGLTEAIRLEEKNAMTVENGRI